MLPLEQYLAGPESFKACGGLHIIDLAGQNLQLLNLNETWQLPSGDVDTDEMPDETARHEAAEETGLLRARGHLLAVVVLPPPAGGCRKWGSSSTAAPSPQF